MNRLRSKSLKFFNPYKSVVQTIYDIVKAHRGELRMETQPARAGSDGEGEGSEFIIQLPIV